MVKYDLISIMLLVPWHC